MPQTDEGEVSVDAELAVGTRIERMHDALERLEGMIRQEVPGDGRAHQQRAAAAASWAAPATAAT